MLLALVAVLALPFIAAATLITTGWRPATAPHYGELLAPAAPLSLDDLRIVAGPEKSALAGRWLLVAVEPHACAAECVRRLDELRRLHVALYKAMPRVRRVLLAPYQPAFEQGEQPDLTIASFASWPALAASRPAIYLIDPRGLAVLRYDAENFAPRGLLKDAERLLRYSWSG